MFFCIFSTSLFLRVLCCKPVPKILVRVNRLYMSQSYVTKTKPFQNVSHLVDLSVTSAFLSYIVIVKCSLFWFVVIYPNKNHPSSRADIPMSENETFQETFCCLVRQA